MERLWIQQSWVQILTLPPGQLWDFRHIAEFFSVPQVHCLYPRKNPFLVIRFHEVTNHVGHSPITRRTLAPFSHALGSFEQIFTVSPLQCSAGRWAGLSRAETISHARCPAFQEFWVGTARICSGLTLVNQLVVATSLREMIIPLLR